MQPGDLLFALDDTREQAAVKEAASRLAQAEAQARDLATGARDEEIAALEAQLEEAEARLDYAAAERKRLTELAGRGVVSASRKDQAIAEHEAAAARVETLKKNIAVARLPARSAAEEAAIAARDAASAALAQAEWQLAERRITAKTAGRVEEVFHRKGEFVTAGAPVVALLPPGALKVRFFVAQEDLDRFAAGAIVKASSDAHETPVDATITFIAREAEFTPPVIYSADTRKKLVFLIEARLSDASGFKAGEPVDIHLP